MRYEKNTTQLDNNSVAYSYEARNNKECIIYSIGLDTVDGTPYLLRLVDMSKKTEQYEIRKIGNDTWKFRGGNFQPSTDDYTTKYNLETKDPEVVKAWMSEFCNILETKGL